ncbi:MAG: hypothetical protein AB7P04_03035 [Bacteriovoracia bacterium]
MKYVLFALGLLVSHAALASVDPRCDVYIDGGVIPGEAPFGGSGPFPSYCECRRQQGGPLPTDCEEGGGGITGITSGGGGGGGGAGPGGPGPTSFPSVPICADPTTRELFPEFCGNPGCDNDPNTPLPSCRDVIRECYKPRTIAIYAHVYAATGGAPVRTAIVCQNSQDPIDRKYLDAQREQQIWSHLQHGLTGPWFEQFIQPDRTDVPACGDDVNPNRVLDVKVGEGVRLFALQLAACSSFQSDHTCANILRACQLDANGNCAGGNGYVLDAQASSEWNRGRMAWGAMENPAQDIESVGGGSVRGSFVFEPTAVRYRCDSPSNPALCECPREGERYNPTFGIIAGSNPPKWEITCKPSPSNYGVTQHPNIPSTGELYVNVLPTSPQRQGWGWTGTGEQDMGPRVWRVSRRIYDRITDGADILNQSGTIVKRQLLEFQSLNAIERGSVRFYLRIFPECQPENLALSPQPNQVWGGASSVAQASFSVAAPSSAEIPWGCGQNRFQYDVASGVQGSLGSYTPGPQFSDSFAVDRVINPGEAGQSLSVSAVWAALAFPAANPSGPAPAGDYQLRVRWTPYSALGPWPALTPEFAQYVGRETTAVVQVRACPAPQELYSQLTLAVNPASPTAIIEAGAAQFTIQGTVNAQYQSLPASCDYRVQIRRSAAGGDRVLRRVSNGQYTGVNWEAAAPRGSAVTVASYLTHSPNLPTPPPTALSTAVAADSDLAYGDHGYYARVTLGAQSRDSSTATVRIAAASCPRLNFNSFTFTPPTIPESGAQAVTQVSATGQFASTPPAACFPYAVQMSWPGRGVVYSASVPNAQAPLAWSFALSINGNQPTLPVHVPNVSPGTYALEFRSQSNPSAGTPVVGTRTANLTVEAVTAACPANWPWIHSFDPIGPITPDFPDGSPYVRTISWAQFTGQISRIHSITIEGLTPTAPIQSSGGQWFGGRYVGDSYLSGVAYPEQVFPEVFATVPTGCRPERIELAYKAPGQSQFQPFDPHNPGFAYPGVVYGPSQGGCASQFGGANCFVWGGANTTVAYHRDDGVVTPGSTPGNYYFLWTEPGLYEVSARVMSANGQSLREGRYFIRIGDPGQTQTVILSMDEEVDMMIGAPNRRFGLTNN